MNRGDYNVSRLAAVKPGQRWWMVEHRDGSDRGRGQHYFEYKQDALDYAELVDTDPDFRASSGPTHPALTGDLRIKVFHVERLS